MSSQARIDDMTMRIDVRHRRQSPRAQVISANIIWFFPRRFANDLAQRGRARMVGRALLT